MKYPCKECISYAMCKQRIIIECDIIYDYKKATYPDDGEGNQKFWRLISRSLPSTKFIFNEQKRGFAGWAKEPITSEY